MPQTNVILLIYKYIYDNYHCYQLIIFNITLILILTAKWNPNFTLSSITKVNLPNILQCRIRYSSLIWRH